jgi:hypothetical protein
VLGLGHATNIVQGTDLMGARWTFRPATAPVISDCDLAAFRAMWSWRSTARIRSR